jgi:4-amino-4-deoxy-L-arabinose transferase-like glycosyltransferase
MKHHLKIGNGTIAILLACITAIILAATASDIGVTWDEPVYIESSHSYAKWIYLLVTNPAQALKPATIDSFWGIVHEHPPVERIWSGLVYAATRQIFDNLTANRLGSIFLVAILIALLYLMVAPTYGKGAGLFAVAALLSMPRFFYHSHLVALDVPVAAASFALTFLFWKSVDRKSWTWGLLWGVVWGLAVSIKLNGVIVPIAMVAWFLIFRRKWSVILRLFLMGIVAILTFFMVWPWLYHDTWTRVLNYIYFQVNHYDIGQWYLGQYYLPPPWHYVFVILWAVVPLTVMGLFLAGIGGAGRGRHDGGLAWLLTISAFVSISPFMFGKALVYDGERLFMSVFPFLAALAGIGFGWLVAGMKKLLERIKRPALTMPAAFLSGIALLMPQVVTMTGLYPHLLSYYSEGVGGLSGATKLGLETTYWCDPYAVAIPYLNAHAKPDDAVWVEDKGVFLYYQLTGRLRPDIWFTSQYPAIVSGEKGYGMFSTVSWYVFQYRQSQYGPGGAQNYLPLQILETQKPVYEIDYRGVPLLQIYGALK